MVDARIERKAISQASAVEVASAFIAPTTFRTAHIGSIHDSDLYAVRGLVARSLKYAQNLSDTQVQLLTREEVDLSMLTMLQTVLTVGTPYYLLNDPSEERVIISSDTALEDFNRRFLDRAIEAISDGTASGTSIAPWLYAMSHKGCPERLMSEMGRLLVDPQRVLDLFESHRGYTNPVVDLASYSGLSAADMKRSVERALNELGLQPSEWGLWPWFQRIEAETEITT